MLITEFTGCGYRTHRRVNALSFVNPFVINHRGYCFISQHYADAFHIPNAFLWLGSLQRIAKIALETSTEPHVDEIPREIQQIVNPMARREAIQAFRAEHPIYVSKNGLVDDGWLTFEMATRPARPEYPQGPVHVTLDISDAEHVGDGIVLDVASSPPPVTTPREFMLFAPDETPIQITEYSGAVGDNRFGASYMVRYNRGPSYRAWQPALDGVIFAPTFAEARKGILAAIRLSRWREEVDRTGSVR